MQRVMQNNAAVFRTQETLEEGRPIEIIASFFFFLFASLNEYPIISWSQLFIPSLFVDIAEFLF